MTPTVMPKTSCSQPAVCRGSKVTCRKDDTMKPATMPDRKENPRSCSLRSSCHTNKHCRRSCLGFWCCGRSQGRGLYSACKEACWEP